MWFELAYLAFAAAWITGMIMLLTTMDPVDPEDIERTSGDW